MSVVNDLRKLRWIALGTIVLCSCGCALWNAPAETGTRPWSDSMGQSLRGGSPPAGPAVASSPPAKNDSFWQKLRDPRVEQIQRNLDVDEPAGW